MTCLEELPVQLKLPVKRLAHAPSIGNRISEIAAPPSFLDKYPTITHRVAASIVQLCSAK